MWRTKPGSTRSKTTALSWACSVSRTGEALRSPAIWWRAISRARKPACPCGCRQPSQRGHGNRFFALQIDTCKTGDADPTAFVGEIIFLQRFSDFIITCAGVAPPDGRSGRICIAGGPGPRYCATAEPDPSGTPPMPKAGLDCLDGPPDALKRSIGKRAAQKPGEILVLGIRIPSTHHRPHMRS